MQTQTLPGHRDAYSAAPSTNFRVSTNPPSRLRLAVNAGRTKGASRPIWPPPASCVVGDDRCIVFLINLDALPARRARWQQHAAAGIGRWQRASPWPEDT